MEDWFSFLKQNVKKNFDYIIVGQGIAGTIMAFTLLKNQKTVLVIDEDKPITASKIAAGLYNPIVFKRIVKSWMADDLIPFMDKFYHESEDLLNSKFYHKKQIVKLFADESEKELWIKKSKDDVGKYLNTSFDSASIDEFIDNPFGAALVEQAGNLDTSLFLNDSRNYFNQQENLLEEIFDFDSLIVHDETIEYKNIVAKKIIFCDGYKATENKYFNWLPFKLTKGEILTISIPSLKNKTDFFEKVINKGCFVLPIGNNLFKVGATYEWNDLSESPTEKGKLELIEKTKKVITVPIEIVEHKAGVRPTVSDRRPLLGLHPEFPSIAIFNGLGTKGVMLAPYFANHFFDFLENKNSLQLDVDIKRFL